MIRGFDDQAFQRRINNRVGLNRDGKAILRLSYAPLVYTRSLGEEVPRYWTRRWKDDAAYRYEQPDRWVIEKRLERESYWDAYQKTRYQEIDGELIDLGPPPEDFYVFEYLIAVHDEFKAESGLPQCCERAWEGEDRYRFDEQMRLIKEPTGGRRRCWGEYREPDDSDLTRISRAVCKMHEDPYHNPYAPLSVEQLAVIEMEANLDAQRIAEEARKREQEISDDFKHSYGWRLLETDAGKLSHGRYHFLGNAWKAGRNGLTVIDN